MVENGKSEPACVYDAWTDMENEIGRKLREMLNNVWKTFTVESDFLL